MMRDEDKINRFNELRKNRSGQALSFYTSNFNSFVLPNSNKLFIVLAVVAIICLVGSVGFVNIFSNEKEIPIKNYSDERLVQTLSVTNADAKQLLAALNESSARVKIGNKSKQNIFVDNIFSLANDKRAVIRIAALNHLYSLNFKPNYQQIATLIECLSDKDELVRAYAGRILGEINHPGVKQTIKELIDNEKSPLVLTILQPPKKEKKPSSRN